MLSGVGMTDIAVGKALRNGLVRQIAVRARNHDGAEDLPRPAINAKSGNRRYSRTLKSIDITRWLEASVRLQADIAGGRCIQAMKAIWESVGAFPCLHIDEIRL